MTSQPWVYHMTQAYLLAHKSRDPSTQVGALVVDDPDCEWILGDVNRIPLYLEEQPDRFERPTKYHYMEHAERNLIYQALNVGVMLDGLMMVCPWLPCHNCARALVSTHIRGFVYHKQAHDRTPDHWRDDFTLGLSMMREAKMEIIELDASGLDVPPIRNAGELWSP